MSYLLLWFFFFFSSRRRHTRYWRDWSSDVCSSDLIFYNQTRDKLPVNEFFAVWKTTTTVIRNLKKYTKYFFAVRGMTSYAGNISEIVSNVTFEDSKLNMLHLEELTYIMKAQIPLGHPLQK